MQPVQFHSFLEFTQTYWKRTGGTFQHEMHFVALYIKYGYKYGASSKLSLRPQNFSRIE